MQKLSPGQRYLPANKSFFCIHSLSPKAYQERMDSKAIFSLLHKLRTPFRTERFKFSRDHKEDAFDNSKIIFLATFQKIPHKTARYSSSNILRDAFDDSRVILW